MIKLASVFFFLSLFLIVDVTCQLFNRTKQQNKTKQLLLLMKPNSNTDVSTFKTLVSQQNLKVINKVNSNPKLGYTFEANSFIGLTQKQVRQMFLTLIPSQPVTISFAKTIAKSKPLIKQEQKTKKIVQTTTKVTFASSPSLSSSVTFNQINKNNKTPNTSTISSFARNMAIFPPSVPLIPVKSEAQVLEDNVLNIVKNYFNKKKQIPKATIENQIIPKYKYKGNLNQLQVVNNVSIPTRRFLQQQIRKQATNQSQNSNLPNVALDQSKNVDWTCISGSVKAQGNCGACYIFSAIDNAAALMAIYYFTFFIQLSAQQIIDCSSNSLVFGCQGGFIQGTFAYMSSPGIYTNYTYPYTSAGYKKIQKNDVSSCQIKQKVLRWRINDFVNIARGDCSKLKQQLRKHPVTVGITGYKMLYYRSGVFSGCDKTDDVDHAVLLIGYKAGVGWKIKNSWGKRWGEGGYAWISQTNSCRICQNAFYPIPAPQYGQSAYQTNNILAQCPTP